MGFWKNLKKSIKNSANFNPVAYRHEIELLDELELRQRHAHIQHKVVSSVVGAGGSIAAAPATFGLSLVLTGVSIWRMDINTDRLKIIKARLNERGWQGNEFDAGDLLVSAGPVALGHLFAPAADHLIDQATGHAAEQLAIHHGTSHVAEQAANHVAHMAGNHGAGMGDFVGPPEVMPAAHEAIYKSTHTGVGRLAEERGEAGLRQAVKYGAEMALGAAGGLAVDKIKSSRAAKQPLPSAPDPKPHVSSTTAAPTGEQRQRISPAPAVIPTSLVEPTPVRYPRNDTPTKPTSPTRRSPPPAPEPATHATTRRPQSRVPTRVPPCVQADPKARASLSKIQLLSLLYPALIHTLFGPGPQLWIASCTILLYPLVTRVHGIPRAAAFAVPVLALLGISESKIWATSLGLVGLDMVGWTAVVNSVKVVFSIFLASLLTVVVVLAGISLAKMRVE